jgi:hypothetical protein
MYRSSRPFLITFFAFLMICLFVSRITAQQKKWLTYHGDFASFYISSDYELDYKNKGKNFTYFIKRADNPDNLLVLSSGYVKMDFKLSGKKDYKIDKNGPIDLINTKGLERRGMNPSGNIWREAYVYYAYQGGKITQARMIYIYYDNVPPAQSKEFDEMINSIAVKNPLITNTGSGLPTPGANMPAPLTP